MLRLKRCWLNFQLWWWTWGMKTFDVKVEKKEKEAWYDEELLVRQALQSLHEVEIDEKKMNKEVVHQPRTAIIEAVKIVLERVYHKNACAQCTLGMLLDELGFQEYEFVAAGIGLSCIYATKTTINWDALMTAIEIKRSGSLPVTVKTAKIKTLNINVKSPQERAHWLNEALKTGGHEEKVE
jgi:hypothetical protein